MAVYQVGKTYMVPVARGNWCEEDGDWVIMGPWHEDADILKFPEEHYHIDPRFLPRRCIRGVNRFNWANAPLCRYTLFDRCLPVFYLGLQPRVCIRRMPPHPFERGLGGISYQKLAESVRGRPLNLERPICPHRGMDLSTASRHGCIKCPLHGLQFDAKTGCVLEKPISKGAAKILRLHPYHMETTC